MEMVSRRAGLAHEFRNTRRRHLENERLLKVDHIRPADRIADPENVGLRELVTVGLDKPVEHGHMEIGQHVIRLGRLRLMIASGEYADFLSGFTEVADRTPGRCGQTVPGRIIIIDDKEYSHFTWIKPAVE